MLEEFVINSLDEGIRNAVVLLNKYGFKTFESCEGGEGHCYDVPNCSFFSATNLL